MYTNSNKLVTTDIAFHSKFTTYSNIRSKNKMYIVNSYTYTFLILYKCEKCRLHNKVYITYQQLTSYIVIKF